MIVECPGCTSRYDVSGRPPGTRARCQCGTVFELPQPSNQAGLLECPRCGGSVSATNHKCEFCRVDLLVKACPRCFSRMFHGSRHCTQCGTMVLAPACANADGQAEKRACPRCQETFLEARMIGDMLLDDCPKCLGTFVDANALERILSERQQTKAQAILGELAPSESARLGLDTTSGAYPVVRVGETATLYVKCPDCHNLMNRRNFAKVIVDVCRDHGTWFDKDELAHVIEFASRGGVLNQAGTKRAEETKAQASERIAATQTEWAREVPRHRFGLVGELLTALGHVLTRSYFDRARYR